MGVRGCLSVVVAHKEREFWKVDFLLKHAMKTKVRKNGPRLMSRGEVKLMWGNLLSRTLP